MGKIWHLIHTHTHTQSFLQPAHFLSLLLCLDLHLPRQPEGWLLTWLYFYILSWVPESPHLLGQCNLPFWLNVCPHSCLLPPFGARVYKEIQRRFGSTRVCCYHTGREFLTQATALSAPGRLPGKNLSLGSACTPGGPGSPPWAWRGALRAHGFGSTRSQGAKQEPPRDLLTARMDPAWER